MQEPDQLRLTLLGLVMVVLLVSSPTLGAIDLTPPARGAGALGDGTADASVERLDADRLRIDRGRFGTGVWYLRAPAAVVAVESVTGRPRLVYRLEIPALEFERTETHVLRDTGRTRLSMSPRAFTRERVNRTAYRATVTVRIQSFAVDRTIARRNVTIRVAGGESRRSADPQSARLLER